MKKIHIYIMIAVIVLVIAFAIFFPGNAYFNKKSATLRLFGRFRMKTYRLKDYMGKTEFSELKSPFGAVGFDVDFQTAGKIKYKITLIKNNEVLKEGEVTYNYRGNIVIALPDQEPDVNTGTGAARAACSSCRHN